MQIKYDEDLKSNSNSEKQDSSDITRAQVNYSRSLSTKDLKQIFAPYHNQNKTNKRSSDILQQEFRQVIMECLLDELNDQLEHNLVECRAFGLGLVKIGHVYKLPEGNFINFDKTVAIKLARLITHNIWIRFTDIELESSNLKFFEKKQNRALYIENLSKKIELIEPEKETDKITLAQTFRDSVQRVLTQKVSETKITLKNKKDFIKKTLLPLITSMAELNNFCYFISAHNEEIMNLKIVAYKDLSKDKIWLTEGEFERPFKRVYYNFHNIVAAKPNYSPEHIEKIVRLATGDNSNTEKDLVNAENFITLMAVSVTLAYKYLTNLADKIFAEKVVVLMQPLLQQGISELVNITSNESMLVLAKDLIARVSKELLKIEQEVIEFGKDFIASPLASTSLHLPRTGSYKRFSKVLEEDYKDIIKSTSLFTNQSEKDDKKSEDNPKLDRTFSYVDRRTSRRKEYGSDHTHQKFARKDKNVQNEATIDGLEKELEDHPKLERTFSYVDRRTSRRKEHGSDHTHQKFARKDKNVQNEATIDGLEKKLEDHPKLERTFSYVDRHSSKKKRNDTDKKQESAKFTRG